MQTPATTSAPGESTGPHVPDGRPPQLLQRLAQIRHVALDMDGTIYRGSSLFTFTNPFLASLTGMGIGYSLVTNNSSKSVKEYVAHLRILGVAATADQVYTSTQASLEYLRGALPSVQRLFVLGTAGMSEEVVAAGYALTADSAADEPDAVLVGFDLGLSYARLCRAAYWIKQGKPFIASHPDRVCPTDQPTVLVDCGSICAALTGGGRTRAGRGARQAGSAHAARPVAASPTAARKPGDGWRPALHRH